LLVAVSVSDVSAAFTFDLVGPAGGDEGEGPPAASRNVITSSIIVQPDRCSRRSTANQHWDLQQRLAAAAADRARPVSRSRSRSTMIDSRN
jgi:hypothetical protein